METIFARSIESFDRKEWNALFVDDLEDWDYYRAVEKAALAQFECVYFAVSERGRLRAAVPGFVTEYRIDTTLNGSLKRVAGLAARIAPHLLGISLVSLGSPVGEACHLGFAADCGLAERKRLTHVLLDMLLAFAAQQRISMVGVKDARGADDEIWAEACSKAGLRRMPGQATALLDLPFRSLDDYLASLSAATRKDLRRKLRERPAVRIEWRTRIDDVIDQVMDLYRTTLRRAEYQFEELTPAYFSNVLRHPGGYALCVTYWLDRKLIAFNLVLRDRHLLLDKFFGMHSTLGRAHNLYYLSWLENVRYCIEHGIARYQSGQGLEHEKVRLGSRLAPNWLWYRHRNCLVDRLFASMEHMFRLKTVGPKSSLRSTAPA